MRLHLRDAAYMGRFEAFLQSVGRRAVVAGPQELDVGEIEDAELDVYLRVWHVMHPEAEVTVHR